MQEVVGSSPIIRLKPQEISGFPLANQWEGRVRPSAYIGGAARKSSQLASRAVGALARLGSLEASFAEFTCSSAYHGPPNALTLTPHVLQTLVGNRDLDSFVRMCVERPVGILYEHPQWFLPLFAELERRGIPFERIHAASLLFDPADLEQRYSLVLNRMSPSAWTRGHERALFSSLQFLAYLERTGTAVLNGHDAYLVELSKVRQIALLASLGIEHPRTRVIDDPALAVAAAGDLEFPVVVKPNIGGSGAGISSYATLAELEKAGVMLGLDGTALIQEQLPAEGDSIVRIEILDGRFLYAIRLLLMPGSFNLCPADYCELPGIADGVSGRGLPIENYQPPAEIIDDALRIVEAAGLDLGGVEYLVNARTGKATFYDINALSNFVANAPEVIGFDPFANLVDTIAARADLSNLRGRAEPLPA